MATDIKIEVIENVLNSTSEENVIEVSTETSIVEVHNADGLNGTNGKSAYEQAVEGGFEGTEEEFIKHLNDGINGYKDLMPLIYAGL